MNPDLKQVAQLVRIAFVDEIDERYRIMCVHVKRVLADCPKERVINFIKFVDDLALELLDKECKIAEDLKGDRYPEF